MLFFRYPWESARTGTEVTDFCCPEIAMYQHHITADVAFAYRSHLAATYDKDWFEDYGCEIAYNTAKFWASRVSLNTTSKLYDIHSNLKFDFKSTIFKVGFNFQI